MGHIIYCAMYCVHTIYDLWDGIVAVFVEF
jgi:hypothetical protein